MLKKGPGVRTGTPGSVHLIENICYLNSEGTNLER
jgi:hypothetical protein